MFPLEDICSALEDICSARQQLVQGVGPWSTFPPQASLDTREGKIADTHAELEQPRPCILLSVERRRERRGSRICHCKS